MISLFLKSGRGWSREFARLGAAPNSGAADA
jgi:hypothetical protein